MAQTSIGFNGSISAVQWAQGALLLLSVPATGAPGECGVSQVAGTRAVSVGAGRIAGNGVVTTLSSAEQVDLPTPTNGQWFLVALNRSWSSGSTSFVVRNGPTTAAATSGAVPASYPASMTTNPGVNADVPVAWVWGTSNSTTLMIVPLLVPAGSRSGTTAQRDAFYAAAMPTGAPDAPAAAAAFLRFSAVVDWWSNTETGQREHYVGPLASTNPGGVSSPGWYGAGAVNTLVGGRTTPDMQLQRQNNSWSAGSGSGTALYTQSGGLIKPVRGVYELTVHMTSENSMTGNRSYVQIVDTAITAELSRSYVPVGEYRATTSIPFITDGTRQFSIEAYQTSGTQQVLSYVVTLMRVG